MKKMIKLAAAVLLGSSLANAFAASEPPRFGLKNATHKSLNSESFTVQLVNYSGYAYYVDAYYNSYPWEMNYYLESYSPYYPTIYTKPYTLEKPNYVCIDLKPTPVSPPWIEKLGCFYSSKTITLGMLKDTGVKNTKEKTSDIPKPTIQIS